MKNGPETKRFENQSTSVQLSSVVFLVTPALALGIIVLHQQGLYSRGQQRQPNEGILLPLSRERYCVPVCWVSFIKEISPEYSLEGLMLKLKLQYFGHLILGKIEGGRRRG